MSLERLPGPLREVAEHLAKLPGLGPKSALRAALALLKFPREQAEGVGRSILTLRERLCLCGTCASLAESDPCPICADATRNREQLCVVSEWDSLLALEEMGLYAACTWCWAGSCRRWTALGRRRWSSSCCAAGSIPGRCVS